MGVEITVIDDSDAVGWVESALRVEEVYMTSVATMVDNVIARLRSMTPYTRVCTPTQPQAPRMSRLNLQDHGNRSGFELGTDYIDIGSITRFQAKLQELRPYFEEGGFVHLRACDAGQAQAVLVRFAQILNVRVFAGTGTQRNTIGHFNTGDYVRADPDGSFHKKVGRP